MMKNGVLHWHRPFSLYGAFKKEVFMNYSPKHSDTKMRLIYGALIVIGLALASVGAGAVKAVLSSVSLICIALGLYLFIRYDLTTYTYIVMENEGRQDFYIDRAVGKRGSYVCYYPLCDLVLAEAYEKDTKKKLYEKYNKIFAYEKALSEKCFFRFCIFGQFCFKVFGS